MLENRSFAWAGTIQGPADDVRKSYAIRTTFYTLTVPQPSRDAAGSAPAAAAA